MIMGLVADLPEASAGAADFGCGVSSAAMAGTLAGNDMATDRRRLKLC
jgi:hypothetical protein